MTSGDERELDSSKQLIEALRAEKSHLFPTLGETSFEVDKVSGSGQIPIS